MSGEAVGVYLGDFIAGDGLGACPRDTEGGPSALHAIVHLLGELRARDEQSVSGRLVEALPEVCVGVELVCKATSCEAFPHVVQRRTNLNGWRQQYCQNDIYENVRYHCKTNTWKQLFQAIKFNVVGYSSGAGHTQSFWNFENKAVFRICFGRRPFSSWRCTRSSSCACGFGCEGIGRSGGAFGSAKWIRGRRPTTSRSRDERIGHCPGRLCKRVGGATARLPKRVRRPCLRGSTRRVRRTVGACSDKNLRVRYPLRLHSCLAGEEHIRAPTCVPACRSSVNRRELLLGRPTQGRPGWATMV
eukprot:1182388-Prorocentrum_minimum.AAC.5